MNRELWRFPAQLCQLVIGCALPEVISRWAPHTAPIPSVRPSLPLCRITAAAHLCIPTPSPCAIPAITHADGAGRQNRTPNSPHA